MNTNDPNNLQAAGNNEGANSEATEQTAAGQTSNAGNAEAPAEQVADQPAQEEAPTNEEEAGGEAGEAE